MAMQWEIHDGNEQVGPLDEDHVVRMIAEGLPATVLVRPAGKDKWKNIRSHAPFAMALEARGAAAGAPPPSVPGPPEAALPEAAKMTRTHVLGVVLGLIIAGGVVILLAATTSSNSAIPRNPSVTRDAPDRTPTPVPVQRRPVREEPVELTECRSSSGPFWECPIYHGNPMPFSTFKSTSVETPTVFRLSGKLSDYYNYEYRGREKSHYSVDVREDPHSFSGRVHVYISRKDPTAEALFDLLKDGNPHMMTVELAYNKISQSTDIAKMTRFICEGWKCDVPAR